MKIEEIRKLLHTRPFRPFKVHVADGGRIMVNHEDFVALEPAGREMIVYQPNSSYQIVDMLMVTRLEVLRQSAGKPKQP